MKKLKLEQLKLLETVLTKSNIKPKRHEDLMKNGGVTAEVIEIKLILDVLSNEFTTYGLDKTGEPTEYGKLIDDLITFFSNLATKYN